MFNEFCITDINLSLPNKTITIKANFKIEENTVNLNTVKVKDAMSGELLDYTLEVKGYRIIITLRDWPKQNNDYVVSVSGEVTDKLDRFLGVAFTKTVVFKSQIKYKTSIVSPKPCETIKGKELTVTIETSPEIEDTEENKIYNYNYQISTDSAFCDILYNYTCEETDAYFVFDEDKQYFLRARVVKDKIVGDWSDVVDFVMVGTNKDLTDEDCDCDNNKDNNQKEELSPFLEDMLSMETVLMDIKPLEIIGIAPNGKTSKTMLVYFNQDLEEVPNHLLMLRGDL